MYRLEIDDSGAVTPWDVPEGVSTAGRSDDCTLVLDDRGVSRHHLKFFLSGGRLSVEDLQSKNGTRINGAPLASAELRAGDVLEVGRFKVTVRHVMSNAVVLSEDHVELERGMTRDVAELAKQWNDANATDSGAMDAPVANGTQVLRVLSHAAQTLVGAPPVESVLQHVLEVVFQHIPCERGFLLLIDPANGALVPMAARYRQPDMATGRITISKTIVDQVVRGKVAVLTADAATDGRFQSRQSIMLNAIRSAMVAPVWNKDEVMGVIHVDSTRAAGEFDSKHLDLLCAMANYAAVAVERARLHQKATVEERRRERLGRFLSPQVATRVLASEDAQQITQPELREVSVLFADLVGFTSMAEHMPPTELAALLNGYLSAMTEVIFQFDGTLDKYIGDAIMAVFGAPLAMEDHASRAVQAALAMQDRLKTFNEALGAAAPLQNRIGINSGKVVAGEIGSPNKREYTVLGDTVNIASRLESSVARPGMVVIGEATHALVKDAFTCDALGSLPLKGKKTAVSAFHVRSAVAKGTTPWRVSTGNFAVSGNSTDEDH